MCAIIFAKKRYLTYTLKFIELLYNFFDCVFYIFNAFIPNKYNRIILNTIINTAAITIANLNSISERKLDFFPSFL